MCAGVAAFVTEEGFVCGHVEAVPGEEEAGVVDPAGLVLVGAEEVVEAGLGTGDAGEGGTGHEAVFGGEVGVLVGGGQGVPGGVSGWRSKGGFTDQARRWRGLVQVSRLVGRVEAGRARRKVLREVRRYMAFFFIPGGFWWWIWVLGGEVRGNSYRTTLQRKLTSCGGPNPIMVKGKKEASDGSMVLGTENLDGCASSGTGRGIYDCIYRDAADTMVTSKHSEDSCAAASGEICGVVSPCVRVGGSCGGFVKKAWIWLGCGG